MKTSATSPMKRKGEKQGGGREERMGDGGGERECVFVYVDGHSI